VKQRAAGGSSDVADLEHGTSLVELYHAGGGGIYGLIRFSLHQSWSYRLESFSPIP
jgi:hypothetical protein